MRPYYYSLTIATVLTAICYPLSTAEKKVVTYLGTDFILPGGCPPPPCQPKLRNCEEEHGEMLEKFNTCMATKSKKQGCFTDRLPDGKLITIPQLANFCSKHCSLDNQLASVHECPYEGVFHASIHPELERQIGQSHE